MSEAVQTVLRAVAEEWGLTIEGLLIKGNHRHHVRPRQVAALLCRLVTPVSYPALGMALRQHHTTVLHSVETIESLRQVDVDLDALVRRLERKLRGQITGLRTDKDALPQPAWKSKVPKHAKYPARSAEGLNAAAMDRAVVEAKSVMLRSAADSVRMHRARFDVSEAPAAGTACAFCRERRHFCPAKGFAGDLPLCRACGESAPCGFDVAFDRMRNGYQSMEAA